MKNYWYPAFVLCLVILLFAGGPASGQQLAPDVMYVYNSSGTTLLGGKFAKMDTTWTQLGNGLDTTQYLHQWTASSATGTGFAHCTTYVGSTKLKGTLSDTLKVKNGAAFNVKAVPVTAASGADSIFVYGWGGSYPFLVRTDSAAITDTLIFPTGTTTGQHSKYGWYNIDSVRIRTANAGLDSVELWYRGARNVTNADSNGVNILGVVLGTNRNGKAATTDTIKSTGWGYVATSGVVRAWADGGSRNIDVGDLLSIGTDYKVEKFFAPVIDTIRTSAAINRRYIKGARTWDGVVLTKLRHGLTGGTVISSADSSNWAAEFKTDTLRVIQITFSGSPSAGFLVDSLSYMWVPRSYSEKGYRTVVGRALERAIKDSTAILIRLDW